MRHSHPQPLQLLTIVTMVLSLLSCSTNCRYAPLDGFWRVDTVNDITTGTTADGQARLFMSFEYEFVKLSWLPENRTPGFLGYECIASCTVSDDGTVVFGPFYKYREEDTLAPADKLASFGIPYGEPTSFTYAIEGSQLTLTNATTQLQLTRY